MFVRKLERVEYKHWIEEMHYAKRMPSISYAFGMFLNNKLTGVCTFGMPPSSTLAQSIAGKKYKYIVIELNRLITLDDLPKNALSQFIAKCFKLLPTPKIIVSFADPNNGHHGYIYQATNFIYTGESSNTTQWIDKDGKEFHFRNIGHYQKNNKLDVSLNKRRINEDKINKVDIANYLRSYKGNYTAKQLDIIFGYKDTAAHWFRTDRGFSFPKIDDWYKLKKLLNFDETYDEIMCAYELVPCANEIIKKLGLQKIKIKGKHRYIYIIANKKDKKNIFENLKLKVLPYPKGKNKNYEIKQQKQQGYLL